MAWVYLLVAGLLEIAFAVALKESAGFTRPMYTAIGIVSGGASLGLLTLALRDMPVGTAYAVWTGIGGAGTAVVGIWMLGEAASAGRLVAIALILAGVAGLKLSETTSEPPPPVSASVAPPPGQA